MGRLSVLRNQQSWNDYITRQDVISGFERALKQQRKDLALQIRVSQEDQRVALQSGLGALGANISSSTADLRNTVDLGFYNLADGLDRLNADFNLLLGDVIWKLEIQQESLHDILQEIRIAEFEREARSYRIRGEDSYFNGWYPEALKDFLAAEQRNYKDFSVLRSIANIYFYHLIDLPKAVEYYQNAAKYARPCDARQAAEAHYFAAMAWGVQRQFKEALVELRKTSELNPILFEAHYEHACFSALLNNAATATESLEVAITGDQRYYERARSDQVFDEIRDTVQALLDDLLCGVQEKTKQLIYDLERAMLTAQTAGALKEVSDGERVLQEIKEASRYDDYVRHVEIILTIPQVHEKLFQAAEMVLGEKIATKDKELAELQQSVDVLRDQKAALQVSRKEYENSSFDTIAIILFCLSVLLFSVIGLIVFLSVTGYDILEKDYSLAATVAVMGGVVVSIPPIWLLYRIGYSVLYRRQIVLPRRAIEQRLIAKELEIEPHMRTLVGELVSLNNYLLKCKSREYFPYNKE